MIRGLTHRCTIWRPTATPADAYGQPTATAYAIGADDVRCRFSAGDAAAPRLLLARGIIVDRRDRITNIRQADGTVIDAGPFALAALSAPTGRVRLGYRRATLHRLVDLDQE